MEREKRLKLKRNETDRGVQINIVRERDITVDKREPESKAEVERW